MNIGNTMRLIFLFFFATCFSLLPSARADDSASEKLLQILERKGYLSKEEVAEVKEVLREEEKKKIEVVYKEGLHLRKKDGSFDVRVGGLVQADMRIFDHNYPREDKFDIRRARMLLEGKIFDYFQYKLEAELEGSQHRRLTDGYVGFNYFPFLKFKAGQFKEPFSLEHLTSDKYIDFIERSMAYHLTPKRDVGLMIHGSLLKDALDYGIGIFNGHGTDESGGEVGEDDKDICGRITVRPFKGKGIKFLEGLHLGISHSYAHIKRSDVDFAIKTAGFTEFLEVTPRAKFYLLLDVNDRRRTGTEMAWTWGPLAVKGEWIRNDYHDLALTSGEEFDFSVKAWYVSGLFMLTGEHPEMKGGVFTKICPDKNFSLLNKNWGAWALAFRLEKFNAERIIYEHLISDEYFVRGADAFTFALNWYLNSMVRICFNYSRYDFSSPLYLGTDEKGKAMYVDNEDIFATRFQIEF